MASVVMAVLRDGQERLHKIANSHLGQELIEQIVYDNIELVMTTPMSEFDEPKTFMNTLFVNKKPIRREAPLTTAHPREHVDTPCDILSFVLMV